MRDWANMGDEVRITERGAKNHTAKNGVMLARIQCVPDWLSNGTIGHSRGRSLIWSSEMIPIE